MLSDAGRRVVVLGVPGTYPPEPVNGVLAAGFDSPVATEMDPSFVYPRASFPLFRDWRFADFQETRIGPGWHERALPALLDKIAVKERIALDLMRREPWDFFMMVFSESDTVAHHFWLFHDPASPRHRPGPQNAIRDVYTRLDAAVGALCDAAGADCTVAVVSDHGFGGAGTTALHVNNWLAEQGLLAFGGAGGGALKRLALTLAPERLHGTLFRHFRGLATRAEASSRFGGIAWERTTAWSEELNYFPSVRVNLEGREPCGQVRRADYAAFVTELCARLETWPPIAKAWPRDALYDGPHVARAPDILLEPALEDGYSYTCLRRRGGPASSRIAPGDWLGGKDRGMNGTHRPDGVLFLSQPTAKRRPEIADIAPTALAALGVPGPLMDGTSLTGGGSTTDAATGGGEEEIPYDAGQEALIEERLRRLGYFE